MTAVAVVVIDLPATPIVQAVGRKRVVPAEEAVKDDAERVVDQVQDRVIVHRVIPTSKAVSRDRSATNEPTFNKPPHSIP